MVGITVRRELLDEGPMKDSDAIVKMLQRLDSRMDKLTQDSKVYGDPGQYGIGYRVAVAHCQSLLAQFRSQLDNETDN